MLLDSGFGGNGWFDQSFYLKLKSRLDTRHLKSLFLEQISFLHHLLLLEAQNLSWTRSLWTLLNLLVPILKTKSSSVEYAIQFLVLLWGNKQKPVFFERTKTCFLKKRSNRSLGLHSKFQAFCHILAKTSLQSWSDGCVAFLNLKASKCETSNLAATSKTFHLSAQQKVPLKLAY